MDDGMDNGMDNETDGWMESFISSMTSFTIRNDCLHPRFDSLLYFCVHVKIAHRKETSLVLSMFISYYRQQELISLYCVQAIAIFAMGCHA